MLHPTGELRWFQVQLLSETDALQCPFGRSQPLGPGQPCDFEPKGRIVENTPLGEECERLEHHGHGLPAQAVEFALGEVGEGLTADGDGSRAGLDQSVDHPQQGRFA